MKEQAVAAECLLAREELQLVVVGLGRLVLVVLAETDPQILAAVAAELDLPPAAVQAVHAKQMSCVHQVDAVASAEDSVGAAVRPR